MTPDHNPQVDTAPVVEQRHRDAAADWVADDMRGSDLAKQTREGVAFRSLVKAFARFEAEHFTRNAVIEEAARVAEREPELSDDPPAALAHCAHELRAAVVVTKRNIAKRIRALASSPVVDERMVERLWSALKERICADPENAKRCVMVGEDDLRAALTAAGLLEEGAAQTTAPVHSQGG